MMRPVTTRAEYMALRGSNEQQQLMAAIRNGNETLKHRLVQMNYSCLPNADGTLRGSTRMSNTVGMDIDHLSAEEMPAVRDRILDKKDELGLGMLEESARGCGYHLVFTRRPHMSQVENLQWAAQLLGVDYDAQAKDITRVFFTTGTEQLIYLDDAIFASEEVLGTDSWTSQAAKPSDTDLHGLIKSSDDNNSCNSRNSCQEKIRVSPCNPCQDKDYNGMAYSDIIAKYWELFNGGKLPVVGDRNALTFELAVTLRSICGYSLEGLQAIVPNYWAAPDGTCTDADRTEYLHTLENALKEPRRGMPLRLKQVLQALKEQQGVKACGGTVSTPPPMPKRLPPLIKLLTRNVPWYYKPAVASAVFPALGAHLHGVHFRYWDNVDHEATFMNLLVGRQSVGKGSIKKPIEYIMEDIRQRDLLSRQREAEWKQKNPTGKQKKDPRPADICIQMLIDNLTDAVFNQRVVDANNNGERYIYTIVDEVEALKKVTSSHKADEVGLLIRKAFDNSMAGQERVGADSVSGIAPLRWNFNASTTPPNARKFFYKMVNDGTVSRLDVATIIRPIEDDDEAPILGIYDDRFAAELKPYIDRLDAANGLIECPQARKLALDLKQENADTARLYESEAYRVLSYRANVIAWLKGMVLYVAHGYRWDKQIAEFVRWSEQYNLWCKMLYFGTQLEKELNDEQELQRHSGPQNLLELLPDEFTREQYLQMRQQAGRPGPGDSTLRTWQARGHIAFDETSGRYVKINK
ncbi:MAG: hypothetical protein II860_08200 [Prevotella sp.]|nr:hypothetical protein [Prevotella sp.]